MYHVRIERTVPAAETYASKQERETDSREPQIAPQRERNALDLKAVGQSDQRPSLLSQEEPRQRNPLDGENEMYFRASIDEVSRDSDNDVIRLDPGYGNVRRDKEYLHALWNTFATARVGIPLRRRDLCIARSRLPSQLRNYPDPHRRCHTRR